MSIIRITNPFSINNHITLFINNNNPTIEDILNKTNLKNIQLYSDRLNSIKKNKSFIKSFHFKRS